MSRVTNLSARDLDGVLGLVAEAAAADGDTPFEPPLIDRLTGLIPAECAGYFEYEDFGSSVFFVTGIENAFEFDAQEWTESVSELLPSWPLHDGRLRGLAAAAKFSDFVGERAKRGHPWYAEVMRPSSNEHECKLLLPDLDRNIRGFFFIRAPGRCDFDERDRAILTVLRMHLAAIRERWERRRRLPPGLTAREVEILQLLDEGLTNRQIAEKLVISSGTVRTHLEHVFEKLGVHTRTAAVTRAFGSARKRAG